MYGAIRGLFSGKSRNLVRIGNSLSSVDMSSPPNIFLDVESPGRSVRETDFSLYPFEPLNKLIIKFNEESRGSDLIANLVHRAMSIYEASDLSRREELRRSFQSDIYAVHVKMFAEQKGYGIFEIYNRQRFGQIAPKVKPEKMEILIKLITQPILRIVAFNRSQITIDPNEVMQRTGVDGFRSIMDLFHLDLRLLTARNLDRLLSSMRSGHKRSHPVHFDLLRVWFQVWDESYGVRKSVGENWSLERVLIEIIRKQSRDMLLQFFVQAGENVRNDLVKICRSRHAITGTPKYPWANDAIDSWLIEMDIALKKISDSSLKEMEQISDSDSDCDSKNIFSDAVSGVSNEKKTGDDCMYLVSEDAHVTRVKQELKNTDLVGLSFPVDTVLSIATTTAAYVIDLSAVNVKFVAYLVKSILNDSSKKKVVYSLESFLDCMQSSLEVKKGVHFENLIDLRRGRIRRSLANRESINEDVFEAIPGLLEPPPGPNKNSLYEKIDFFFCKDSLSHIVQQVLGYSHDRSVVSRCWLYRPLPSELVRFAASDASVLVELELSFRNQRMIPCEILSFDPFT